FKNTYVRRKKKNHNEMPEDTDYVDLMGDRWKEFTVYHHNVKEWYEITGNDVSVTLPQFFVESGDINWRRRVELQALMTHNIDHSISSCLASDNHMVHTDKGLRYIEDIATSDL